MLLLCLTSLHCYYLTLSVSCRFWEIRKANQHERWQTIKSWRISKDWTRQSNKGQRVIAFPSSGPPMLRNWISRMQKAAYASHISQRVRTRDQSACAARERLAKRWRVCLQWCYWPVSTSHRCHVTRIIVHRTTWQTKRKMGWEGPQWWHNKVTLWWLWVSPECSHN